VRACADARLDEARRIHADLDRLPAGRDLHAACREGRRAVAGALGEGGEPDAKIAVLCPRFLLARAKLRKIDVFDREIHRLDVARLVESQPGRRDVGKPVDQAASAQFARLHAEGGSGAVHQPLDRKGDHRPRHATVGRHRASVREHATRATAISAHVIGTRQFRHGHERLDRAGRREARIGADVGRHVGGKRDELAVAVEAAFERDGLIAAVERGDQILAPVLAPGDRALQLARQPHQQNILGRERHFLPEAAAHVGSDDAQLRLRQAE